MTFFLLKSAESAKKNQINMKTITLIARILVGLLFIFSGFIKANDAVGFSYKLVEYFEVFGTHFLIPIALPLAIFIVIFEMLLMIKEGCLKNDYRFKSCGGIKCHITLRISPIGTLMRLTGMSQWLMEVPFKKPSLNRRLLNF